MIKSKILFNEPPLTVPPSLAILIGLNEAIAIQQLHYWLCNPKAGMERDGFKWIFNTLEEWRDGNFPFWSTKTIARTWGSLGAYGLVIIKQFDQKERNMRNYYRIDYDALDRLEEDNLSSSKRTDRPLARPQDVPLYNSNTETLSAEKEKKETDAAFREMVAKRYKILEALYAENVTTKIVPLMQGILLNVCKEYDSNWYQPAFEIYIKNTMKDRGAGSFEYFEKILKHWKDTYFGAPLFDKKNKFVNPRQKNTKPVLSAQPVLSADEVKQLQEQTDWSLV